MIYFIDNKFQSVNCINNDDIFSHFDLHFYSGGSILVVASVAAYVPFEVRLFYIFRK